MIISPAQLPDELRTILKAYSAEVEEAVDKAGEKAAKAAAAKLKTTSPVRAGGRGGAYAKGWTTTKRGKARIVYNKPHYQLTHLLEYGHATRNGGRTKAIPHIKPVEEEANKQFADEVKEAVSKVG